MHCKLTASYVCVCGIFVSDLKNGNQMMYPQSINLSLNDFIFNIFLTISNNPVMSYQLSKLRQIYKPLLCLPVSCTCNNFFLSSLIFIMRLLKLPNHLIDWTFRNGRNSCRRNCWLHFSSRSSGLSYNLVVFWYN